MRLPARHRRRVRLPVRSGVPDSKIRIYDAGAKKAHVDFFPACVHLVRCALVGRGWEAHLVTETER